MSSSDRFAPATSAPGTPDPSSSSTTQHGLVTLSDYRRRRAELLDAQGRDALLGSGNVSERSSEAATPADGSVGGADGSAAAAAAVAAAADADATTGTAAGIRTGNGGVGVTKTGEGSGGAKKKRKGRGMLSFADDHDDGEGDDGPAVLTNKKKTKTATPAPKTSSTTSTSTPSPDLEAQGQPQQQQQQRDSHSKPNTPEPLDPNSTSTTRITANASLSLVPKLQSKSALRREALEREALRQEFLTLQAAVKASEIAIPFVFHDGTDLPGGTVRVRKGDPVWLFLDRGRKVGATRAVGGSRANNRARREWARVSVDDLMLVRGTVIIPPHYEIYFFILNKTTGPGGRRLFDYTGDAPLQPDHPPANAADKDDGADDVVARPPPPIETLEGAGDDPSFTKVVNRRWFERNKHIYPATLWQEFDPEKDYNNEIKRDLGGNTFFYSR